MGICGKAGVVFEHAWGDGAAVLHFMNRFIILSEIQIGAKIENGCILILKSETVNFRKTWRGGDK